MREAVLSINAGSSSIKFALFGLGANDALEPICAGKIEGIGSAPHLIARDAAGQILAERRWEDVSLGHDTFLDELLSWLETSGGACRLVAIGHRVVHGGTEFFAPALVTKHVMDALARLVPLAPLHQPHNLAAIFAAGAARPSVPQVACFDTAFHQTQPAVATRFAIPLAYFDAGIRRYGFHGLSYEYVARILGQLDPDLAAGRVIAAHLGNGASLCALASGRSIDTTMGFTALDGLMMGTRCGAIDPGVILYLQQQKGMSADAVERLLYAQSGLLGVSGLSSDMRDLLASCEEPARQAVELFVYRIVREAEALASSLGGLDGLVFTAGIGENSPAVRALVCRRLAWLGVAIDAEANEAGAPTISTAGSRVTIRVIPTDEECMIAMHALGIVRNDRELEVE
ncbi:MAG TPA: acetate/propionate family kinase [Allosphingosinicella sp.]|nr:acetate/propionate family kinase [Allosphingosinicella sp.]